MWATEQLEGAVVRVREGREQSWAGPSLPPPVLSAVASGTEVVRADLVP